MPISQTSDQGLIGAPADPVHAPGRRNELELLQDQLAGLAAWQRDRREREAEHPSAVAAVTREVRLDMRRRMAARRLEQAALVARSEQQMRESRRGLAATRAVIAHRSDWVRQGVKSALSMRGVQVVASLDNGAEALGVTVLEQPDLLLIDELLPSMTGLELVGEVALFAPRTVMGAQVESPASADRMLQAGVRVAFTRRSTHRQIADELLLATAR